MDGKYYRSVFDVYSSYLSGLPEKSTQSLFSTMPVHMPKPELYVIYTGDSTVKNKQLTLSEEFFGGEQSALDVRIKVITDGQDGDIINQYVIFTKVINGQVRMYGRTRKAIVEAIRICKDQNVLKEYLDYREKEVVDIMVTLFDQREVLEDYMASEDMRKSKERAKKLYETQHMSPADIANVFGYSVEIVEKWLGLVPRV